MELENFTQEIYTYIKNEMNHSKDFDMDSNIIESGLIDSAAILNLLLFLETQYGIAIDLEDINVDNFEQVEKIAILVNKLKK